MSTVELWQNIARIYGLKGRSRRVVLKFNNMGHPIMTKYNHNKVSFFSDFGLVQKIANEPRNERPLAVVIAA